MKNANATRAAVFSKSCEVPALLSDDPVLEESIALRNPYVDPMSLAQIELLARARALPPTDELERALAETITGIAAGLAPTPADDGSISEREMVRSQIEAMSPFGRICGRRHVLVVEDRKNCQSNAKPINAAIAGSTVQSSLRKDRARASSRGFAERAAHAGTSPITAICTICAARRSPLAKRLRQKVVPRSWRHSNEWSIASKITRCRAEA